MVKVIVGLYYAKTWNTSGGINNVVAPEACKRLVTNETIAIYEGLPV